MDPSDQSILRGVIRLIARKASIPKYGPTRFAKVERIGVSMHAVLYYSRIFLEHDASRI